ncbi:MAG: MerR family transcriptional regulator [Chloroflexi bacterium]|nr:MerR family transcriptional regulator [Chloroflexota bacterium]
MLKIGDFSKLSRVSVKTLRYYDEIGLLRPLQSDRFSGYRYYAVEQLRRLNRILALKDLGFALEQIAGLLDKDGSASELYRLLQAKRAELQAQIDEQQSRLVRIETRLRQIEQETAMPTYDVVVKTIEPQTVVYVHDTIPTYADLGQLFGRVFAQLGRLELKPVGAPVALYYDAEYRDHDVDVELDIPVNATSAAHETAIRQLPGGLMACLLHSGSYDAIGSAYTALMNWIESNGYRTVGPSREVYLRGPESGDASAYLTEVQLPVEKA